MHSRIRLPLTGLLLLTAGVALADDARDFLFVIDSSGSMSSRTKDGAVKIDVAREVLLGLAERLPPSARLGLMAYGHRYGADDARTCEDIELVLPISAPDPAALAAQLERCRPRGRTPITASLRKAVEAITAAGGSGSKVVILVTDGIETCGGDPIGAAGAIRATGAEFYVVGFDLTEKEEKGVGEIASAGGGKFLPARDGVGYSGDAASRRPGHARGGPTVDEHGDDDGLCACDTRVWKRFGA